MDRLDPQEFGLPARTVLARVDDKTLALVIDRKSRIIMADGKKILERVEQIRRVRPGVRVQLMTSAPLCSKTRTFLQRAGVIACSL